MRGVPTELRRPCCAFQFGVSVSTINPGSFKTPLLLQTADHMNGLWSASSPEVKAAYGEDYARNLIGGISQVGNFSGDPKCVIEAMENAVTSTYPRVRYVCGYDAQFVMLPWSFLPTRLSEALWRLGFALVGVRVARA